MDGGRLVGFFDWDTASPSPREDDLAFSALLWVPLTAPEAREQSGPHDVSDRARRLDLLLDAYRYDSDRPAFGAAIIRRARRQAAIICECVGGILPPEHRGPHQLLTGILPGGRPASTIPPFRGQCPAETRALPHPTATAQPAVEVMPEPKHSSWRT